MSLEIEKRILIALTSEISLRAFYIDFINFLVAKGWKVEVVTSETRSLVELSNELGIQIHPVPMSREPSPISDLSALIKIFKVIRLCRPSLVMTATPKASLLTMVAAKLAGVDTRLYQIWGLRYESSSGLKRNFLKLFEKLTSRLATSVTANSKSLANLIISEKITKKVTVIGAGSSHGINLNKFDINNLPPIGDSRISSSHEADSSNLNVLFIGRINKDKGIETLIKAFEIASKANRGFNLTLLGNSEDDALTAKIDSISDKNLVRLEEVEDIRPYLARCDVLCLPTLREGFPNVVLEAAAMGVPSIVSDATGAVDSVVDRETGYIFPTGDSLALENTIQRFAISRDQIKIMGEKSRLRATELFSQDKFFPKFENYLCSLIESE